MGEMMLLNIAAFGDHLPAAHRAEIPLAAFGFEDVNRLPVRIERPFVHGLVVRSRSRCVLSPPATHSFLSTGQS